MNEYLIGIRLREVARADDFLTAEDLELHVGDLVVVSSESGETIGEVRRPRRPLPDFKRDRQYPRVLRATTEAEAHEWRERREAEERVDFRELVRDLAREFRARVEMRQIGARDVTKVMDGIGPCGRQLCCSSHLRGFEPISVKMAKAQDVPLTDSRLLGNCGRLKCCLLYEFSLYEELRSHLPRVGTACQAECGGGGCMQ